MIIVSELGDGMATVSVGPGGTFSVWSVNYNGLGAFKLDRRTSYTNRALGHGSMYSIGVFTATVEVV